MSHTIHILGGRGFLGASLATTLQRRGHRVTIGDRPVDGAPAQDVGHFASIVRDHDWIVHTASSSTPGSTATHPLAEVERNLRPLAALLEAMQGRPGARLVYLSSAGTTYADGQLQQLDETAPQAPCSYHGATKVAAEQFLRIAANPGQSQITVVRPSNVYGPGQVPRPGFGLVSTALARCLDGKSLQVFGDGKNVRDYLYVDDFSELIALAIASPYQAGFEVFNASFGQGHTLLDVLAIAEDVTGRTITREFKPARQVDPRCVVPDPGKARDRFGWQPRVALPEGLRNTWEWLGSASG